jgi:hypothetical protein
VDALIEHGEMPRAKRGGTAAHHRPREVAQCLIARLDRKGEGTAQAVFKQMAKFLGFEVTEKATEK